MTSGGKSNWWWAGGGGVRTAFPPEWRRFNFHYPVPPGLHSRRLLPWQWKWLCARVCPIVKVVSGCLDSIKVPQIFVNCAHQVHLALPQDRGHILCAKTSPLSHNAWIRKTLVPSWLTFSAEGPSMVLWWWSEGTSGLDPSLVRPPALKGPCCRVLLRCH